MQLFVVFRKAEARLCNDNRSVCSHAVPTDLVLSEDLFQCCSYIIGVEEGEGCNPRVWKEAR